jgi:hypothetical protein
MCQAGHEDEAPLDGRGSGGVAGAATGTARAASEDGDGVGAKGAVADADDEVGGAVDVLRRSFCGATVVDRRRVLTVNATAAAEASSRWHVGGCAGAWSKQEGCSCDRGRTVICSVWAS